VVQVADGRIPDPKKFFTKEEEQQIMSAIQQAEKNSSGEIRVHLAKRSWGDVYKTAVKIFNKLGMYKTKQRNGVLIFICLKTKKFAIIGDKGINDIVGKNFWDDVAEILKTNFKQDKFVKGLTASIILIGEKLKKYFPYTSDDVNELNDEISKE
jgi:uncharacterized membrane protein